MSTPSNTLDKKIISQPATALATSWAPPANERPGTDATAPTAHGYLDALVRLGAQSLLLVAGSTVPVELAALSAGLVARQRELPVVAVEGVLGALRLGRPRAWRARACALDRDEAQAAVEVTRAAMELAVELRAPAIVVSLGSIGQRGDGIDRLWRRLRGKLVRGVLAYDDSAAEELRDVRAALGSRHFDAAMRSLDQMVEDASRRGVRVLLRNPARGLELPAAIELSVMRSILSGAPLGPLLDMPAAHLASMLRLQPLRETVMAFADGTAASLAGETTRDDDGQTNVANLSDACGPLCGLVPGQGEVDLPAVARLLPPQTQRVFVPWASLTTAEVRRGYTAVANL